MTVTAAKREKLRKQFARGGPLKLVHYDGLLCAQGRSDMGGDIYLSFGCRVGDNGIGMAAFFKPAMVDKAIRLLPRMVAAGIDAAGRP